MNAKNLLILVVASFVSVLALSGCKNEAVTDLEKIRDKACGCKGDMECVEAVGKEMSDWAEKHKEAVGTDSDAEKITEISNEIAKCIMPGAGE